MHRSQLQGTYDEIGQQQGQELKHIDWAPPPYTPQQLDFARACQEQLGVVAPELLTEMNSLIDASEMDADAMATLTLTAPFADDIPACSFIAVMPERSTENRVLVGRNYDYIYDISQPAATTYLTYPTGRYASLGNSDIWVGRADGLNEAGLFIAVTALFLPGIKPGLAFWFIVRMLLDRCATVDEALKLLHKVPHAQSRNYVLVDRYGSALAVEATTDRIEVRSPENGILVVTNHAVCPSLAGKETFLPSDSPIRYQNLRALAEEHDMIDLQTIKRALGNRETHVCAHGDIAGQPYGTIWSLVGHVDERQLDIADGSPTEPMQYHTVCF